MKKIITILVMIMVTILFAGCGKETIKTENSGVIETEASENEAIRQTPTMTPTDQETETWMESSIKDVWSWIES